MSFRITPSLGPDSDQKGPFYFDNGQPGYSFELGSRHTDNEGRERIYLVAGGTIAADTQLTFDSSYVATSGSGGWYTPVGVAVAEGDTFHAVLGDPEAFPIPH